MNTQESQHQSPAEQGVRFPSPEENYLAHLKSAERLPKELRHLQHTFSWPVDITDPNIGITCFYGDNNYLSVEYEWDPHHALDIQMPLGTHVYSPMSGKIMSAGYGKYFPDPRGMMDIEIYDADTGIDLSLSHLRPHSIPKQFMNPHNRKHTDIRIQQGDYAGEVGEFFNKKIVKKMGFSRHPNPKRISPERKRMYGRTYNHLDIYIRYYSDREHFETDRYFARNFVEIDPILLFERLY